MQGNGHFQEEKRSPILPRITSTKHVTSSVLCNKDESGRLTDVEENQLSEGESNKKSSNESFIEEKKPKLKKNDKLLKQSSNQNRKTNISSSGTIMGQNESHQVLDNKGKLEGFSPAKMHVLQPHSHRRHYTHHLKDHFSSPEILRQLDKNQKKISCKEIVPTLDACEYKDTNFLTEGSPPRTPTHRPYRKARSLSTTEEQSTCKRDPPVKQKKDVRFLPASYWKEPNERRMQWRSSPESDSGSEISEFNTKYLNRFRIETVSGPQSRSTDCSLNITRDKNALESKKKKNIGFSSFFTNSEKSKSRTFSKDFRQAEKTKIPSKPFRETLKRVSKSQRNDGLYVMRCKNCIAKRKKVISSWTQTEWTEYDSIICGQVNVDLNKNCNENAMGAVDLSAYLVPHIAESVESYSISTEDTSSISPDDGDFISYDAVTSNDFERINEGYDILVRLNSIKVKILNLKKEAKNNFEEVTENDITTGFTLHSDVTLHKVFMDMQEIVREVEELYDHFVSEDKEREFNELRKQLQRYRKTCRILEQEIFRVNSKLDEFSNGNEIEEEMKMTQQISTALYWELRNVDAKLQKITSENDLYREKVISCQVQNDLYQKKIAALRNEIDQMSLHASSVPTNEYQANLSRDINRVAEMHHQIQFQEEEKKELLKKLIKTDKKKEQFEEKLGFYLQRYGQISQTEEEINEEEKEKNNMKERIREANIQFGLMGRKIIQLEMENDRLKQIEKKQESIIATLDIPTRFSLSDIQFLEDEVETLRSSLDDLETENHTLKYELKKFQEKSEVNKDKSHFLDIQKSYSLKGQTTPTASDKVEVWEICDPETPLTMPSDSDLSVTGKIWVPVITAIDACTQTFLDLKESSSEKSFFDKNSSSFLFSKQLKAVLSQGKEHTMEDLVSQLTSLAVATRHLVDETPTTESHSVTNDLHSSNERQSDFSIIYAADRHHNFDSATNLSTDLSTVQQEMAASSPCDSIQTQPSFGNFHIFLLSLMAYIIVTSLPLTSSIKLAVLGVFFFFI